MPRLNLLDSWQEPRRSWRIPRQLTRDWRRGGGARTTEEHMNRKAVAALVGLGLAAMVTAPALASNQTNPGARVAQLGPQTPGSLSKCNVGTGGGNGFTMFNAPGQPGSAVLFQGEVSLKNAD